MFEVFKITTKEKGFFKLFATRNLTLYFFRKHIVLTKTLFFGKKEWMGPAFFSSLSRTKSEVGILCKGSKNFKVEFENSNKAGRIISVTVEHKKTNFK